MTEALFVKIVGLTMAVAFPLLCIAGVVCMRLEQRREREGYDDLMPRDHHRPGRAYDRGEVIK